MTNSVDTVLLTGASGFIGHHILRRLESRGCRVLAISRKTPDDVHKQTIWRELDLHDGEAVSACLAEFKPKLCIHSAWFVEPGFFWSSPKNIDWIASSLRLANSFIANGGSRFVGVGSQGEYGVVTEAGDQAGLHPTTLYGATKDATRRVLGQMCRDANVSFAWGRVFNVFGHGEPREKIISSTIRQLSDGSAVRLENPMDVRDFIDVRDVGSAIAALASSKVEGCVDIGSGTSHTVQDVVQRLAGLFDAKLQIYDEPKGQSRPATAYVANTKRLSAEVGFSAEHRLMESLSEMISLRSDLQCK